MDAKALNLTQLWNAQDYQNSGRCPWTIFAYPASLADEQLLPRDEESIRYLRALIGAGRRSAFGTFSQIKPFTSRAPMRRRSKLRQL